MRLRQHRKKTTVGRAEALDRQGQVWRRQLVRKRSRGRGQQEGGTWGTRPRRTEQAPWLFRRRAFSTDSAPHALLTPAEAVGEGGAADTRRARPAPRILHGDAGQLCSHATMETESSSRTRPQKQNQRKATPSVTRLSNTHSLVQRNERGHTTRSSWVRDSVSELGGEAKEKKRKKM